MAEQEQTVKKGSPKRSVHNIDWAELGFKVGVAMAMGLGSALAGHAVNYAVGSLSSRKSSGDDNIIRISDRMAV